MVTLNNLTKKVNNLIKLKPIFFITADYERALGLEKILDNYHIITLYNKDLEFLLREKVNIFSINKENIKATEIINDKDVIKYITSNAKDQFYIQTFKNSQRFETNAREIHAILLNDTYQNNLKFERKISQYNELILQGVKFPKTKIITLGKYSYEEISDIVGHEFVIQFNIGHTGSGTHFINNKQDYLSLQVSFPKRTARVSKRIIGQTYTVNGCIYNRKAYFSGLSLQITGITPYANTNSATIGNDWAYAYKKINKFKNKIFTELEKVGVALSNNNYRGLFGVDFIIDKTDQVYIIEINARQAASIPMNTKLQLLENQIPLSLLHIAEFLEIKENIDNYRYNTESLFSRKGSQLFIRYGFIQKLKREEIKTGIYSLSKNNSLVKLKDTSGFEYLENDQFILINKNKKYFNIGDEIARIQQTESTIEYDNNLSKKTTLILSHIV